MIENCKIEILSLDGSAENLLKDYEESSIMDNNVWGDKMNKKDLQAIRQVMQEELKPIKEDIINLKNGQTKLELKIENEVDRAIKTIGEGHLDLNQKLIEKISIDNRVEILEHKMSAVELAVQTSK